MSGPSFQENGPSVLGGTLKVVAAVALIAVAAATWLSGQLVDGSGHTRLAAALTRGLDEPLTTGSLANGAGATRLDPCTIAATMNGSATRAR